VNILGLESYLNGRLLSRPLEKHKILLEVIRTILSSVYNMSGRVVSDL
jgi:hypothetical protein